MTNENPISRSEQRRNGPHLSGVCLRCGVPTPERFCTNCGADQQPPTADEPPTLRIARQPFFADTASQPALQRGIAQGQHALHWVGAHGGAGATTLTALVPGTVDGRGVWPADLPVGVPRTHQTPVILTARSTVRGLLAAKQSITHAHLGGLPEINLLGLVVIADAPGRKPREIRDLTRLVCGGVSRSWQIDFLPALRLVEKPSDLESAPADLARLRRDIDALFTH